MVERFSYQGGVVDVDVHISSHLKEELTWAIDKQLESWYPFRIYSIKELVTSHEKTLNIFEIFEKKKKNVAIPGIEPTPPPTLWDRVSQPYPISHRTLLPQTL